MSTQGKWTPGSARAAPASGPSSALQVRDPKLYGNALGIVAMFVLMGGLLLALGRRHFTDPHAVLDTSMFLVSGITALLLRDMAARISQPLLRWIAISLAITSVFEFIHTLVALGWSEPFASIEIPVDVSRPTTWPPASYTLPIGILCSLWLIPKDGSGAVRFTWVLLTIGLLLHPLFYWLPQYSAPVWLGITRPTLILVPLLWGVVALACWQRRAVDRIFPMLTLMSLVLLLGSCAMLYSRSPHDTEAMIAHLGRVAGYLVLLLSLMRMASSDMLERIRAERQLAQLNEELEQRVSARTAELHSANQSLQAEIEVRQQAEAKVRVQLDRLFLLHHITRAIGERQDLQSVFQVVIRRLEEDMPVDFGCVCRYSPDERLLTVTNIGVRSRDFAKSLSMTEHARIPVDGNALSLCVRGELVYEPDVTAPSRPSPHRLAEGGLRAFVATPLIAEKKVFGVLITARRQANGFTSSDCEFLRQLSEHAALAAHQASLYGSLQQAYDELQQSQQTLLQQERLRSLGQIASGVAHDINNAISPVSLYTETLLEQEPGLSARARNYLSTIQRSIDDVAHTVSRMREFYRPREPELHLSRIRLNRLVEQVVELTRVRWRDVPQERGIVVELRAELYPELRDIMGAEGEIRDALTNLVFNAVDAMPSGGILTIRTRGVAGGGSDDITGARLEVSDTGVGMDEETKRRCLEPFFTTKGERGTGLGLAMVYGMVQRHSAAIELDSTPGAGTTFRITFPIAVTTTEPHSTRHDMTVLVPPLRILIVDDDPLITESLRNILQQDGHAVIAADGGQAGIDAFLSANQRGEPFALVITDLGMPYVDGRKVAASIKAASASTPVVLLTGWGQRLIADDEAPKHVDRVLNKPPRLHELRTALSELAARSTAS